MISSRHCYDTTSTAVRISSDVKPLEKAADNGDTRETIFQLPKGRNQRQPLGSCCRPLLSAPFLEDKWKQIDKDESWRRETESRGHLFKECTGWKQETESLGKPWPLRQC